MEQAVEVYKQIMHIQEVIFAAAKAVEIQMSLDGSLNPYQYQLPQGCMIVEIYQNCLFTIHTQFGGYSVNGSTLSSIQKAQKLETTVKNHPDLSFGELIPCDPHRNAHFYRWYGITSIKGISLPQVKQPLPTEKVNYADTLALWGKLQNSALDGS